MKPVPFEYVRPKTVAEACRILAENEDALPIAGGQTLVPMLAMRLARPSLLVDIARLPELSGIRRDGDNVVIGAATRQVETEKSEIVAAGVPLLARALPWVGHQPTRNRGTIGGSIVNADPSAEIPLVARTLDAEFVVEHADGTHVIAAPEFFLGSMTTAMRAGACLREIRFPVWRSERVGVGFHEISARKSDFAYVSAAAQIGLDAKGTCDAIALGFGGLADRPITIDLGSLLGTRVSPDGLAKEAEIIITQSIAGLDLTSDLHASADYRRRLGLTLGRRALVDASAAAVVAPRHFQ